MIRFLPTITVVVLSLLMTSGQCAKLEQKYMWQQLEFDWPSEELKQEVLRNGSYKPENNLPLGLDVWKDKLFITVPRWRAGVAASLNYVTINNDKSPVLRPYPNWAANTLPTSDVAEQVMNLPSAIGGHDKASKPTETNATLTDPGTIISTFRIRVDECDRLWVMDTGLADILGNPTQFAPAGLVIYDLKTDQLIRRYSFPEIDLKEDTFLANVIVDVQPNDCENAFAYVPDLGAYGVVVYSFKDNRSWRVKHNFFHFDPLSGAYNVGGVMFQWTDGVFGMALGKASPVDGARSVYFHALSSTMEFEVSNRVLQNQTRATGDDAYFDYSRLGDRGINGQSTAEFFDEETGVLFYTQVNKDAIGCWNSAKPYTPDTQGLVDSDSDALVFPNDLKIDTERNVWVLSDRMPVFLFKTLNPAEFNYRILKGKVGDLLQGTQCA